MSDAGHREWRFYLDDMIEFAQKVLAYTKGWIILGSWRTGSFMTPLCATSN